MARANELLRELNKIRSECLHTGTYYIENWSYRPGSWAPSRICDNCEMAIAGITQEEFDAFKSGLDKHRL